MNRDRGKSLLKLLLKANFLQEAIQIDKHNDCISDPHSAHSQVLPQGQTPRALPQWTQHTFQIYALTLLVLFCLYLLWKHSITTQFLLDRIFYNTSWGTIRKKEQKKGALLFVAACPHSTTYCQHPSAKCLIGFRLVWQQSNASSDNWYLSKPSHLYNT